MLNQIIAESNYFLAAVTHYIVAGLTYYGLHKFSETLHERIYARLVLHGYAASTLSFAFHQTYWWLWKHFDWDFLLGMSWVLLPMYAGMIGGIVAAFVGLTRTHANKKHLALVGLGFVALWSIGVWLAWP